MSEPLPTSPTGTRTAVPPAPQTTHDVVCLGCGCLCDDLVVTTDAGRVVEATRACALGRDALMAASILNDDAPEATVEGRAVDRVAAIGSALDLLSKARAPLLFGLSGTTVEAARDALELAEVLGARVILDRSAADLGRVSAYQNLGRVSATLGEVKNRADVVIFWGCDPSRTHPRHGERYSIEADGRFLSGGRAGRFVVVVDSSRTATAEAADLFLPVEAGREVEALTELRRRIGKNSGPRENFASSEPQAEDSTLTTLAAIFCRARYGALFFRARGTTRNRAAAEWNAATRLVRELNEVTRFVLLGMGGPGNLAGAEAVLTWQSGFLQGVDHSSGVPEPIDEPGTLNDVLEAGETDLVLALAAEWPLGLSEPAMTHLATIPRILIGAGVTASRRPAPGATVALASAVNGLDVPGTVLRSDGVALPLRPVRTRDQARPIDREWLQELTRGVRNLTRMSC